jgi:light-regulated signal transduction histidine kinase (bacteriophytochrome)
VWGIVLKLIRLNKISIKWRLFIYLSMFVAATLHLLWLFQVVFLQSFYRSIKINEIISTSVSIEKNIDNSNLQSLITQIAQSSDASIIISDLNGNTLYSANINAGNVMNGLSPDNLRTPPTMITGYLVIVRQITNDSKVKIEVIDTGEGISEDKLPLIWDRYYKASKTHKRAAIGIGLGLSIVKTILEQHHAEYGVQSTIGQGSIFWFELEI